MPHTKTAFAIFAHPDDIEFCAAGTLLLLKERGWKLHYLNLSSGDLGSSEFSRDETRSVRKKEGQAAAGILGAQFHESLCDDMQIFYNIENIRRLNAVIREVRPDIILTHSPSDYMSDHENTARLTVSAAFARGMPNFESDPPVSTTGKDVTLYHAMPHGLRDPLRQRIRAELYANTARVHSTKRDALAAHVSQKAWLDETQGMDSYLVDMDKMSQAVGELSGKFEYAEGWRRHLHLGFSATDQDPLKEALGDDCLIDPEYINSLETPS